MFEVIREEIEVAGKIITLETGKIARQADGAVIASCGETSVLCTVVVEEKVKVGMDFLPLGVHYKEMAFAAGKIPGGFFKREGRPSEREVLISRLIDRPMRPTFPANFFNEVQVICTVLSYDIDHDSDIIAMIGSSAALALTAVPVSGIFAGVRIGIIDDGFIVNPTIAELAESSIDLIVAGTSDAVLMVESEIKELSSEVVIEAIEFGHEAIKHIVSGIKNFASKAGQAKWERPETVFHDLYESMKDLAETELTAAFLEKDKQQRNRLIAHIEENLKAKFLSETVNENLLKSQFKKLQKHIVRSKLMNTGVRIDGRDSVTIREICSEVGILPRLHGSALFTRGQTQALVIATLGTAQDEQMIDSLSGDRREHFMLHYNFPPYSVGEATMLKSPGRREIGHGKLAWRALRALMPSKTEFPYTIRVVAEVTESNGSSSMATVCGTSLALMDAGVPLKTPVAGIAMGLIKEGKQCVVLSDITGDEDFLGDMDFKVAGTVNGLTALQMDIKINDITTDIMKSALAQAKDGVAHILAKMNDALSSSRNKVNINAPTITTFNIPRDKIREVIGSGGKVIREICEVSGAKIDIEDDGTIKVAAITSSAGELAIKMINDIVLEAEIGKIYEGTVVKIVPFGAFVNFLGSKDGLVHISEITEGRVEVVEDVLTAGQAVKVKVVGVDNRGKVKLSMRAVNQETGEDIGGTLPSPVEERSETKKPPRSAKPAEARGERSDRGGESRGNRSERDDNAGSADKKIKRKYFD
jgi:polyribonucleotide nucleotidyltransferase